MKFDLSKLAPWADITTAFQQMKSLKVVHGKCVFEGEAELTFDRDTGQVTLEVFKEKKKPMFRDEVDEA